MDMAKSQSVGHMSPRLVAARKRNGLVFEYSQELDALRSKYGYTVGEVDHGLSRLEASYNSFVNLEKIEGGSGESFLKNASRQLAVSFTKDVDLGPLWVAGSRVPAVHRKRMVKLMRYIDRVLGVETCRWYWQQAPTLERYSWRCMYTPLDGSAGHLWKTRCSSLYQLAHKA